MTSQKSKVGSEEPFAEGKRLLLLANLLKKRRTKIPIQCGVGMKGAVPQKGFKMPFKLSITQGPVVDDVIVGMLSMEHTREITTFLCDWYEQFSSIVTNSIEVMIVTPQKGPNNSLRVVVKVVLSGKYDRHTPGRVVMLSEAWKSSFEECFYNYLPNEPGDLISDKEELRNHFNKRLIQTIELEVQTHQSLLDDLNSMLKLELLGLEES